MALNGPAQPDPLERIVRSAYIIYNDIVPGENLFFRHSLNIQFDVHVSIDETRLHLPDILKARACQYHEKDLALLIQPNQRLLMPLADHYLPNILSHL